MCSARRTGSLIVLSVDAGIGRLRLCGGGRIRSHQLCFQSSDYSGQFRFPIGVIPDT